MRIVTFLTAAGVGLFMLRAGAASVMALFAIHRYPPADQLCAFD